MENARRNLIVLRSVYPKSGNKIITNPVKDPKTGRYPDCVKAVNSNNDMILTDKEINSGRYFIKETEIFVLEEGKTFDLSDEIESAQWDAVKNNPLIAPDRDARDAQGNLIIDGGETRYGRAELYIEKPGYESQKKVSKKRLIKDALTYIFEDSNEGLVTKCKLLGKNMSNIPIPDVQDYLIGVSEKNPEIIIELYTGTDTNLRLLFVEAKEKRVIFIKDKLYMYGEGIVLGASDSAAITWMKEPKNKKMLKMIEQDTYPDLFPAEVVEEKAKDKK